MYIAVSVTLCLVNILLLYIAKNQRLSLKTRYLHSRHVVLTIIHSILSAIGFSLILYAVNSFLSVPFIKNILFIITPTVNKSASFLWIVVLLSNIIFLLPHNFILSVINDLWIPFIPMDEYKCEMETEDANIIDRFFQSLSQWFYDGNKLKTTAENVGVWIRGMKIIFGLFLILEALFFTLYIGLEKTFIAEETLTVIAKSLYIIPMISYVILNQVEIFLCADKSFDVARKRKDHRTRLIGDYEPLVELYRKFFGSTALISHFYKGKGDFTKSLYASLEKEQVERVKNPETLRAIYRNLDRCIENKSSKYIDALVDLINGKNVAVVDFMCGEFTFYILSYLQNQLSHQKKAIVVCDTIMQVEDIVDRYSEIFARINRVPCTWRIKRIGELREGNTDILVCTEEELLTSDIRKKHPEFFEVLANVIVVEAYNFICRDKAFLTHLFNYLGTDNVQYAFCVPENNPDIKLALEYFLNDEVIVYDNYNEATNTCIMFWRSESGFKTQNHITSTLYNDFGVGYTIAIIASRYDVLDINIQAPASVPVYSYRNTATVEYARILSDEFFLRESINISDNIKVNKQLIFNPSSLAFNILYDANNNLLSLVNIWLSYGGDQCSMIHMISRPYMLREYFAHNIVELHGKPPLVKLFVPMKVLSTKMAAIAFLLKTRTGVFVEEIVEFAHINGMDEYMAERILAQLVEMTVGPGKPYRVYECFSFDETLIPNFSDGKYVYSHKVKMSSEALYDELCMMTEDNAVLLNMSNRIPLTIHKKDIYNYYLPEQTCICNGERYIIEKIDTVNGEIFVTKEESVLEDQEYTTLYNILSIQDIYSLDSDMITRRELYEVHFFNAKIKREIYGYYASSMGLDFSDVKRIQNVEFETPLIEEKNVSYMELVLKGEFGKEYDKVAALMTILIKGVLETLTPNNYRDIMVFSNVNKIELGVVSEVKSRVLKLIPTVRIKDFKENNSREISIYIVDYQVSESGVLAAIAADIDRMMVVIREYLDWVMKNPAIRNHYLYFGERKLPEIFSAGTLKKWLDMSATPIDEKSKILDGEYAIRATKYCAYCGRAIFASGIDIGDGKVICEVCAKHRVGKRRKIEWLLRKAYSIIQSKYGAIIPPGIGIEFVSKAVIDSAIPPTDGLSTVGFYDSSKNKICVLKDCSESRLLATIIHELVHAWQKKEAPWILDKGKFCEGHTSYVEVQCMYEFDYEFARHLENSLLLRTDIYGEGYRFWVDYLTSIGDSNIFKHLDYAKETEK